jgi:hypothetical protein
MAMLDMGTSNGLAVSGVCRVCVGAGSALTSPTALRLRAVESESALRRADHDGNEARGPKWSVLQRLFNREGPNSGTLI